LFYKVYRRRAMGKNIIVTVVITLAAAIVIMYYGFEFMTSTLALSKVMGILYVLLVIVITGGFLYALVRNMNERIREIKEENEDDNDKY